MGGRGPLGGLKRGRGRPCVGWVGLLYLARPLVALASCQAYGTSTCTCCRPEHAGIVVFCPVLRGLAVNGPVMRCGSLELVAGLSAVACGRLSVGRNGTRLLLPYCRWTGPLPWCAVDWVRSCLVSRVAPAHGSGRRLPVQRWDIQYIIHEVFEDALKKRLKAWIQGGRDGRRPMQPMQPAR